MKKFLIIIIPFFFSPLFGMEEQKTPPENFLEPTQSNLKKQKKDDILFPGFIGEIPEEFKFFCQKVQSREELQKKNITLPKMVLITGEKDTGKTLLIESLAKLLGAYLFKQKEEIAKELQKLPSENQSKYYIDLLKNHLSEAKKNHNDLLFLQVDDSNFSSQTLKKIKEKIKKIKGAFFIVETRQKTDFNDYELFDTVLNIPLPNAKNRKMLLDHFAQQIKMGFEKHLFDSIANKTKYMTAPQLQKIVNEAATLAVIEQATKVTEKHFELVLEGIRPLVEIQEKEVNKLNPESPEDKIEWEERFDKQFYLMFGDNGKKITDNHKSLHKEVKAFIILKIRCG